MKRGFTLVEVLIVVAVIVILTTISVMVYDETQKRAEDGAARAMVGTVMSGVEKYYTTNNEYPLPSVLHGAAVNGSLPANNTAASQALGIPVSNLDGAKIKLIACTASVAACKTDVLNKTRVYYFAKATQTSNTAEVVTTTAGGGNCAYTFPASEVGALSYLMFYFNAIEDQWKVIKGNKGAPTTSNTTSCPITAL